MTSQLVLASFLSPEMEDSLATGIAIFVIFVIPVVLIVLFWLVHILPEKIAHNRHHPQFEAIRTLCLLSLVFGGMLWPIAWIWAYSKPVMYRAAYGTDKHDDWFAEMGDRAKEGELLADEIDRLCDELDRMADNGRLPTGLAALRRELDALPARQAPPAGDGEGG